MNYGRNNDDGPVGSGCPVAAPPQLQSHLLKQHHNWEMDFMGDHFNGVSGKLIWHSQIVQIYIISNSYKMAISKDRSLNWRKKEMKNHFGVLLYRQRKSGRKMLQMGH